MIVLIQHMIYIYRNLYGKIPQVSSCVHVKNRMKYQIKYGKCISNNLKILQPQLTSFRVLYPVNHHNDSIMYGLCIIIVVVKVVWLSRDRSAPRHLTEDTRVMKPSHLAEVSHKGIFLSMIAQSTLAEDRSEVHSCHSPDPTQFKYSSEAHFLNVKSSFRLGSSSY